jgi:aldose 1-epimerase
MAEAVTISDPSSGAEAVIAPHLGFNCISFRATVGKEPVEVIDSPEDVLSGDHRPSSYGIPILFPFPNRIRGGRFTWNETEYQIPLNPGVPNAIHGFCLDRPWRVTEQTDQTVTGRFQLSVDDPDRAACWPADFILEVRYRVIESRLECQFRITNPDEQPLPWGLGTHAYFKVPLGRESTPEDCVFTVPVTEEWELEEYLPTGRRVDVASRDSLRSGVRFGSRSFDCVYTGWESDGGTVRCSLIDERAGLELQQVCDGQLFREAVVFTPPGRNTLCMEPYTCVTDAINLHSQELNTGLNLLDAGGIVQTWAALQVSPLLA